MNQSRVENLLQDLNVINSANYEMVQSVRKMVLGLGADVSEEVKYGGILFSATNSFCGVFAYSTHISLEFSEGATLSDKYSVLEGKGKFRRHIKCLQMDEIQNKHLLHYLKLAYQHQNSQQT